MINVVLDPHEAVTVSFLDTDGKITIDYDRDSDGIRVTADLPDDDGRVGVIYYEDMAHTTDDLDRASARTTFVRDDASTNTVVEVHTDTKTVEFVGHPQKLYDTLVEMFREISELRGYLFPVRIMGGEPLGNGIFVSKTIIPDNGWKLTRGGVNAAPVLLS